MTSAIDLDAYFRRIRWGESARPEFDTLASLLRAHMRWIPFENLDVLLRRDISLDLDALQHKLVRSQRGGYCFEHATLFAAVLEALGFAPVRHSARVVLARPRTASPRTHMFLTVRLPEGTFVVDPGFGGLAPDFPVPVVDQSDAIRDGAAHFMACDGAHWALRTRIDGRTIDCWVSMLEADNPMDFVVANHYTSTHPESGFVNHAMLRALTAAGRVSVMDRDVTIREAGTARSYELADRAALRALLVEHFGFDLPEIDALCVPSIDGWR